MSRFLNRWWWVLLLTAVIAGLWRLQLDVDILNLLPPDEPTVQGLKLYQRHFTNSRELLISLRSGDAERTEALARELADHLRQQSNLVARAYWQPPWMDQPEKMAELLALAWLNQAPEAFSELTNRLAPERLAGVLAETKETLATSMSPMDLARLAFDPYNLLNLPGLTNLSGLSLDQSQQAFTSGGGEFRVVFVYASVDLGGYRECDRWLGDMRATVERLREAAPDKWRDVRVRYTGRPVFVQEIATAMQRDISGSVTGTSIIIAILFWLTHRRWVPMLWLLALLFLILLSTVAIGGLLLGSISIVSMGFAAVLLGLAVDYAVVHYQEALAHPGLSIPEIRRAIAPSILWAAITTICAFLVLNLGGLPGLAQLGTLVALGVALSAFMMVMVYLPPLFPTRRQPPSDFPAVNWWRYFVPPHAPELRTLEASGPRWTRGMWVTLGVVVACGTVLLWRVPGVDKSGDALRPQNSEAEQALNEITREMGLPPEPLWAVVQGPDEPTVYRRLTAAETLLSEAKQRGLIQGYLLPSMFWPRLEHQNSNRAAAGLLAAQERVLVSSAEAAGFNTNATMLTVGLLETWRRAASETAVTWPTNEVSQWLLKRFIANGAGEWMVMGLVNSATNQVDEAALAQLSTRLAEKGTYLSGWNLLGSTTLKRVRERQWLLATPMVLLVLASLWFAFRRVTEIVLGAGVMLLSMLALLAVMSIMGWSWNLLNLMSFPLILGTGVDYSIFMQMALRRHAGDVSLVRRSIGRALVLCGGTAVAGFGSLGWSSNPGMASLGKVCAVGIACNMLIAIYLLPVWWRVLASRNSRRSQS